MIINFLNADVLALVLAFFNLSPSPRTQNTAIDCTFLLTAGASAIASIFWLASFGPSGIPNFVGPPAAGMTFILIAIGCYVSHKVYNKIL